MWVSAFRPTSQHLADPGDLPTQLDLAGPAFDAGPVAAPDLAALPAAFVVIVPDRSQVAVATAAAHRVAPDTRVSSQLARGPPV
jgi:hypothetical protein